MHRNGSIQCLLVFGFLLLFLVGCGPRVLILRGGPTPAWVDRLPIRPGELCAIGYSGTTFYQQDCVGNAADNARAHLAQSISVTIKTITIDISDGTRGSYDMDVFVQGSESASEAVLQGSEIQAQWVDMQGQRGDPNGCFALVCIDPSKPLDKLVQKLEENKIPKKTVDQVRANAEAAFEELEKAEQQHLEKKTTPPPEEQPKTKVVPEETKQEPTSQPEQPSDTEAPPTQSEEPSKKPEPQPEEQPTQPEQPELQEPPTSEDTEGATPAIRKIELPPIN